MRELFVTIQSDDLNVLETVVVAPLDVGAPMYAGDPLVVAVPARETGATSAQVVLVHLLAAVPRERFERDVAGRLSVRSMQRIDETLLAVLAL